MVSKSRTLRIAERIREELTELLFRHVQDPRLTGLTITDVEVDRELAFAEIYVSSLDGITRSSEALHGLGHAQGFLRSELAQRIDLRHFPRLRFHWDATLEKAERIDRLISQLNEGKSASGNDQGENDVP